MAVTLKFQIYPIGLKCANGLDSVELALDRDYEASIQKPAPGSRRNIILGTRLGRFKGVLIGYPPTGEVYIGPTLYSDTTGKRTTLANVMNELGLKPRDDLDVTNEGDVFKLVS